MRRILFLAVLFLLIPLLSYAAYTTVTCTNGETGTCRRANSTSLADVQSAVDAAAAGGYGTLTSGGAPRSDGTFDGDGVYIQAGSATWAGNLTWNNKNILVIGAGQGTCSPSTGAANCSCNPASNTCITTTDGGTRNFMNPTASSTAKMQWRISNIYVTSSQNAGAITINSSVNFSLMPSTAAYGFRIDHMTFNYPSASVEGIILIVGPVFGLLDHINMVNYGEASICTYAVVPTESSYDGTCGQDVQHLCGAYFYGLGFHPGTANRNITIEDSKFWTSQAGNGTFFDTFYYGGKFIFRNNQIWNGIFFSHWTGSDALNGIWFEMYNNVHDGGNHFDYPVRLMGGGTGLVYNNTFKNWPDNTFHVKESRADGYATGSPLLSCNGSRTWDGNAGDAGAPGWPCLAQTGRGNTGITINGSNQQSSPAASYPLYLWNNGTQDACAACTDTTSSSCSGCTNSFTVDSEAGNYIKATAHPNGDVDWSKTATKPAGAGTHTLTYTPLIYPHPLQGGGGGDTTPPTQTISTSSPQAISSDSLTVTGTASDAVGVSGVKFRIGSEPDATHGTACTDTTSWSCATSGYSAGANTLYVEAYDGSGNYSSGSSIVVNYDVTAPTVTAFTLSDTWTMVMPIAAFTATDDVGVADYAVTLADSSSGASFGAKPTTYTWTSVGSKTLYGWARDAAGRVSSSSSAAATVQSPAYVGVWESHSGTTGSTSQTSFNINSIDPGSVTLKAIAVAVLTVANADYVSTVQLCDASNNCQNMSESVSASDTAGEPGRVTLFFLGSGIPSGVLHVVVNRTNNATVMYAVAVGLTAPGNIEILGTPATLANDGAYAEQSLNSGSAVARRVSFNYFGASAVPAAGANTTYAGTSGSIVLAATRTFSTFYRTTDGSGNLAVGPNSGATSDDRASIYVMFDTPDSTPPLISGGGPTGTIPCTSNPQPITLIRTTDEAATVKYDTSDVAYAIMSGTMQGAGTTSHQASLSLACGASYTYYARAQDTGGNTNAVSDSNTFTIGAAALAAPHLNWWK